MPLKIACQMDPIDRIDIRGNSTFALLLEAQRRGHDIFYYLPQHLALVRADLIARGSSLTVEDKAGSHYKVANPRTENLADWDVILLRQDPPFDMAYITSTHLLERIHPKTLVVNDPAHVRNAPEKIFVLDFQDLMPPTLVTRNPEDVREFRDEVQGHHPQAAVRQRRRQRVSRRPRRHQPQLAGGAVPDGIPRAVHGAGIPARGSRGRQAHHPGRRRSGGRDQPRAGGRRDALQHACRRPGDCHRPDAARPRNLRAARARAEAARPAVHRHRRDRALLDRDQRHFSDRHPPGEGLSADPTSPH